MVRRSPPATSRRDFVASGLLLEAQSREDFCTRDSLGGVQRSERTEFSVIGFGRRIGGKHEDTPQPRLVFPAICLLGCSDVNTTKGGLENTKLIYFGFDDHSEKQADVLRLAETWVGTKSVRTGERP